MRKPKITALLLIVIMIAAACLTGCDTGQDTTQTEEYQYETEPGDHVIYGIKYSVPETHWVYMFNAEQLGTGDEWIDLEISDGGYELPELKESDKITINGRDCYLHDEPSGTTFWDKSLIIPQAEEKKYIEVSADFIDKGDMKKADKFFKSLMEGLEFTEDEGYVVCKDYISVGGVRIPAKGLKPSQFFYGLMDLDATDGMVSMQIDFDDEGYAKGVEQAFADTESDDEDEEDDGSTLLDSGALEIDGVKGKWCRWLDSMPDSMTYLTHVIMVPNDDMQTIIRFGYDFNGDVDDLSQYDDQIKELQEQISVMTAEK